MKITLTILFFFLSINSFSQKKIVFEKLNLSDNIRLIGMYPHYDEEKTFEKYNFILEDLRTIDSISKIIVKGKEVKNQATRNEFHIRLLEGDKIINVWSFNPQYSYIRTESKSYEFNAEQILNIAQKFGFKYTFSKKNYSSPEQFDEDYKKLRTDEKLLFVYKPNFKFEGVFNIKFPKTKKFKHPKAISEYIRKKILNGRKPSEYRLYYTANEFNIKNKDQFTMTIESDYGLFENFEEKKAEKGIWTKKNYTATIFIKN
ncbi:hypothetical protein [Aquimarina sp. MMG016]|uniref:hypothetical protein n=1 Tax=Aquimarina sp. MMG016 TaxID=2822690 RepID=UPI001B3A2E16|nr:hypothetical protein [Aquimarina sp. MMG016]MBQ4818613.1 hypothetical protein [Aquimarina sp. MMG016]